MAVHQAAVSVSRRSPPDSLSHPSVGTNKESRVAHEAAEKAKASRPTRSRIEGYCMALNDFKDWAYPDPTDPNLVEGGGEEPDAEGTTQDCSRCKVTFEVSSQHLDERVGECKFHYGRVAPERVEGRRKWIYSCCKRERGEAGCEDGIHVFNEKEDDAKLKKRVGYKSVKQVAKNMRGPKGWLDVVAMDCEMIRECLMQRV
jgi:RNA exonuclease 1